MENNIETSCWLCSNDNLDEMEECSECGQNTCESCGEWEDDSFICHNCIENLA